MFSSSLSRSSLSARGKPLSSVRVELLKCVICGKAQHNNETAKYRMEESERATIFLKVANHLMDEVFKRIADLQDVFDVFTADIRYHSLFRVIFTMLWKIVKWLLTFSQVVKETGNLPNGNWKNKICPRSGHGLTLIEIRDIINSKHDEVEISNKEVEVGL